MGVKSHFEVFGLPARWPVDSAALDQRYRELSLQHHPDRAGKEARARVEALAKTTAINDAYKVLKDPVKRAFHLLALNGVDLDREEGGHQKDMPLEFLEEVIEAREALGAARAAKDVAKARAMAADVEGRRQQALKAGVDALEAGKVKDASVQLGRVRYFTRFLEEVDLIEEEALG